MTSIAIGTQCFCGNSLASGVAIAAPASYCTTACAGDGSETCGGAWSISIASTNPSAAAPGDPWNYLGCYKDGSDRVMSSDYWESDSMSVIKCKSFCAAGGHNFAGLEANYQCFCSDAFSSASATADNCDASCNGDGAAICGGDYALSVYQLGSS